MSGQRVLGLPETDSAEKPDAGPDVLVHTVSTEQIAATHAVQALVERGVPVLNRPAAVLVAADKIATARTLVGAGLPVPRTVHVCTIEAVVTQGRRLGWPVVLKAADGSEGGQVVMLRSELDVDAGLTSIRTSLGLDPTVRSSLAVQEVVEARTPGDRRMFVVNGRVQATMDRLPRAGEWRSNLSLCGRPVAAEATAEQAGLAERAMAAVGLDFGTVDIMLTTDGPRIIEVNAFGDVLDVGMVNGLDLIGALADAVEQRAGLRAAGPISPRALEDDELAELSAFCWARLDAKRIELGLKAPLSRVQQLIPGASRTRRDAVPRP